MKIRIFRNVINLSVAEGNLNYGHRHHCLQKPKDRKGSQPIQSNLDYEITSLIIFSAGLFVEDQALLGRGGGLVARLLDYYSNDTGLILAGWLVFQ